MDQYELIEFFGVLPKIDEDDCYEFFRVERENGVIEIAFFYTDGFSLLLFGPNQTTPIFSTDFRGGLKIKRTVNKNGYDCLELTVPVLNRHWEDDWNYTKTVRIFINPDIKVEILD